MHLQKSFLGVPPVTQKTSELLTGGYYRFVIVAPGTMTQDAVFNDLEAQGWQVRSMGAPPEQLKNITNSITSNSSIEKPIAYWIHATWTNKPFPGATTGITFGPFEFIPVPDKEDKTPANPAWTVFASLAAGAAIVGATLWFTRQQPYRRFANPVDSTEIHGSVVKALRNEGRNAGLMWALMNIDANKNEIISAARRYARKSNLNLNEQKQYIIGFVSAASRGLNV